jgi:pimeloyl-ACP methyl ester carboxylesterase
MHCQCSVCSCVRSLVFILSVLCLLSEMQPSEENTYADIEAVYQCLETEYGISQEDIILYGQSVGSGPTLHLASRLPRLRGVVLQSAILSGLRVVCHVNFTFCFDIYKVKYSCSFSYHFICL